MEKVFIEILLTVDVGIELKFVLVNCFETILFQMLQFSMEILNSDFNAHRQISIKHGLQWKPIHNFTNPTVISSLTIVASETVLSQHSSPKRISIQYLYRQLRGFQ
jgi:hypothetical protein